MSEAKPKIWVHGASGRMGALISEALRQHSTLEYAGGSSRKIFSKSGDILQEHPSVSDLAGMIRKQNGIIDFSLPEANEWLLNALSEAPSKGMSLLIGTTGMTCHTIEAWEKLTKDNDMKLLIAANTSLGVLQLAKAAQQLAKVLSPLGFDMEIRESHHRDKKDAPSGTALLLADAISDALPNKPSIVYGRKGQRQAGEIGIQSTRGGKVFGEHTISFLGDSEELEISHKALSRELFANGAVQLMLWLQQQPAGVYSIFDVNL